MNRSEHVQWCKDRANKIVDQGDNPQAYASMVGDLNKHEETENHIASELGMMLLVTGKLNTQDEMREFINGFN